MNELTLVLLGGMSVAVFIALGFTLCAVGLDRICRHYESRLSFYDGVERLRVVGDRAIEELRAREAQMRESHSLDSQMILAQRQAQFEQVQEQLAASECGCPAVTDPASDDEDVLQLHDVDDDDDVTEDDFDDEDTDLLEELDEDDEGDLGD